MVAHLVRDVVSGCTYYNEWAQQSEIARYTLPKLLALSSAEPESILVARANEAPVGFCTSHNDGMGLIWLGWIGVASPWRRQGLAMELLERLLDGASARGAHKVWCDTRVPNVASAAMLEKAGFARLCELRNHWYGLDYYLWEKPA